MIASGAPDSKVTLSPCAEALITEGFDSRQHDRKILRFTARHYGIDRDLFYGGFAIARAQGADQLIALPCGRARQHTLYPLARRGHHREAISDLLLKELLDGVVCERLSSCRHNHMLVRSGSVGGLDGQPSGPPQHFCHVVSPFHYDCTTDRN
jgi:hypothetical protein